MEGGEGIGCMVEKSDFFSSRVQSPRSMRNKLVEHQSHIHRLGSLAFLNTMFLLNAVVSSFSTPGFDFGEQIKKC